MWEFILITVIAAIFFPIRAIIEKMQSHRYEYILFKILGQGAIFLLTVLVCTFIIILIRSKLSHITGDLTDEGVVTFTATSSYTKSVKGYNGKRMVTSTYYYVVYRGKLGRSWLKHSKKVSGQTEMHNLVKNKDTINLRVFTGDDRKIYYGKESDTVESYLKSRNAWKTIYYKILLISGIVFVLFTILFVILWKFTQLGL